MAKYYAVASAVRISPFFHLVNSIPNSNFASSQMYSFGMVESWPNMALVVQAHIRCAVLLVSHPTYHYSLIPRPHSTRSGNEAIPTIAYLVPRPCSTQPGNEAIPTPAYLVPRPCPTQPGNEAIPTIAYLWVIWQLIHDPAWLYQEGPLTWVPRTTEYWLTSKKWQKLSSHYTHTVQCTGQVSLRIRLSKREV